MLLLQQRDRVPIDRIKLTVTTTADPTPQLSAGRSGLGDWRFGG
jgi:hypothetical protein